MKKLIKVALFLVAVLGFCGISQAQTALTQTTLASQVNGPAGAGYSGLTSGTDGCWTLASVSGIGAPVLPGTPVTVLYAGREAFGVLTVNTSTKIACGFRGYMGTQASPHPNGDMVLISNLYSTNNQFGANPIPSGFYALDPPVGGSCTAANTPTAPWVNVLTGSQWLCSTISKTWVPGFNNASSATLGPPTTAVASATTIVPSGPFFHLTGSTVVTTITTPVGCDATAVGACEFSMIVDTGTASQLGTGGNLLIAAAITTVTGKIYTFVWDAANSKWAVLGT